MTDLKDFAAFNELSEAPAREQSTARPSHVKLMLAMPNLGECLADHRTWIVKAMNNYGMDIYFDFRNVSAAPVDVCRNICINEFLASDNDWLMMLDSDVLPPDNCFDSLAIAISRNLDMIGLPCPIYSHDHGGVEWNFGWVAADSPNRQYPATRIANRSDFLKPNVRRIRSSDKNRQLIIEVDRIGTGCVFIHRRVIEAISHPIFEWPKDERGRTALGEDYYFCDKVKEKGYNIWCDLEMICEHYKSGIPLSQLVRY